MTLESKKPTLTRRSPQAQPMRSLLIGAVGVAILASSILLYRAISHQHVAGLIGTSPSSAASSSDMTASPTSFPTELPPPEPLPSALQGVPEPDDDQNVREDTQRWCRYLAKRSGMRTWPKHETLRFGQLLFRYGNHEAAAACELERLVRLAVPERGNCTVEEVDSAATECRERIMQDQRELELKLKERADWEEWRRNRR